MDKHKEIDNSSATTQEEMLSLGAEEVIYPADFDLKDVKALSSPQLGSTVGEPTTKRLSSGGTRIPINPGNRGFQPYLRVVGSEGFPPTLYQRVLVNDYNGPDPTDNQIRGDLVAVLGGRWVEPLPWYPLEIRRTPHVFYFRGQHEDGTWQTDTGVDIIRQQYTNGYLFQLRFNDNADDSDYNDYIIEFALVWAP